MDQDLSDTGQFENSDTSTHIEGAAGPWELLLIRLYYREGKSQQLGVNQFFLLDNPNTVWLVYAGEVDLFYLEVADGQPVGYRSHLFRAQQGDMLFGQDLTHSNLGILVSNLNQAEVVKLDRQRLEKYIHDPDFTPFIVRFVNQWVRNVSHGLSQLESSPKLYTRLQDGVQITLQPHEVARPRRRVTWVNIDTGRVRFLGKPEVLIAPRDDLLPVSRYTWITAEEESQVEAISTLDTLTDVDGPWQALDGFHTFFVVYLQHLRSQSERLEREQIAARTVADQAQLESTLHDIATTLTHEGETPFILDETEDALLQAAKLVGNASGIIVQTPKEGSFTRGNRNRILDIAAASKVRTRQVALRGEWWKKDAGPIVAYRYEGRTPVALLPSSVNSYELIDPVTGVRQAVDQDVAQTLYYFGHTFYRPFPNHPLKLGDLVTFGLQGVRRDLWLVLLIGVVVGLLQVITPVVSGLIFDLYIPRGDQAQLLRVGGILVGITIASTLFQLALLFSFLRIESKLDASILAGVWDRLLNLPIQFFRQYTAGDLGNRAMSLRIIRQNLSESVTNAILLGMFSVFNLLLLFYYSIPLGLAALVLVLIASGVTGLIGYWQVMELRTATKLRGKISGLILQFINGIAKFRVAGVENRVFSVWAERFSELRRSMYRARIIQNRLLVFTQMYPIIALMVIFALIAFSSSITLTVGDFLAFNLAFTQFLTAGLNLSIAFIILLAMVPIYERMVPILEAAAEIEDNKYPPGELRGLIEVNHVSFRYDAEGPLVLDDVSFRINPGEFVAIVGSSGSGKSTLFRLMLGFEKVSSGSILYDGQELSELDIRAVRQQIGVVLQNSQVMSGSDIFTNIIGANQLTMDDAWEAAEMAGFADDVRQMPMEMYTVVSEGGSTLSGGQRQRLMIARAIVTKPRIVFFDEATSALDNKTQAIVSESLERLDATRIVIAHRLSTIMNADRILVLNKGVLVEQGKYDELIKQKGVFSDLARRQIV
ncbi:MAG: NHLP bacteriocin export ABC transporter permease/ATPase subunit [Chloroflexi bacterium]|nr:NHLP bacteriocin export ABC transporter permease/ATPase subunit [Chloroflexota bacterium]